MKEVMQNEEEEDEMKCKQGPRRQASGGKNSAPMGGFSFFSFKERTWKKDL